MRGVASAGAPARRCRLMVLAHPTPPAAAPRTPPPPPPTALRKSPAPPRRRTRARHAWRCGSALRRLDDPFAHERSGDFPADDAIELRVRVHVGEQELRDAGH